MCLAIPVRITGLIDENTAKVTTGGVSKEVDVTLIESPAVGDYVLLHAGFAIEKVHPESAEETLDMFREMLSEE